MMDRSLLYIVRGTDAFHTYWRSSKFLLSSSTGESDILVAANLGNQIHRAKIGSWKFLFVPPGSIAQCFYNRGYTTGPEL